MKLPPQHLEEEGFFDVIAGAVKKIAPVVLEAAPSVLDKISPTVGSIFRAAAGQESIEVGEGRMARRLGGPLDPQPQRPVLRKKSSMMLRGDGGDLVAKATAWHTRRQ